MWFDVNKAIEVLLYVAQAVDVIEPLLVTTYVADKKHLERWGRLIYGETYVTAFCGVRPVHLHSLLTSRRGEIDFKLRDGGIIEPTRKPNLDLLSESDVKCLEEAVQECIDDWRTKDQEDIVFEEAQGVIKLITEMDIAKTLPCADDLCEYLRYE